MDAAIFIQRGGGRVQWQCSDNHLGVIWVIILKAYNGVMKLLFWTVNPISLAKIRTKIHAFDKRLQPGNLKGSHSLW